MKSLAAVTTEFLRFHVQLLENLFTLQRTQHPVVGPLVATCGIDQIPWHSLYDFRFSTSFKKLAIMVQDGKVRAGYFARFMQVSP